MTNPFKPAKKRAFDPLEPVTLVLLGIITLLGVSLLGTSVQLRQTEHQYEIQQLCDQARANRDPANGAAMRSACERAQRTYDMEFLCSGQDSDASCWVEPR